MRQKNINHVVSFLGLFAALQWAKIFKVSMVIGSYMTFFSINNSLLPLSGTFLGWFGITSICLIRLCVSVITSHGGTFLQQSVWYIPGMVAAYYWASAASSIGSLIVRFLVPMACIILFIAHPTGSHAWPYALYWLIPIGLYVVPRKKYIAMEALGSTFVAHAVGSVLWLYGNPMNEAVWMNLIPVVLIERLLFAGGMIALYHLSKSIMSSLHKVHPKFYYRLYSWMGYTS